MADRYWVAGTGNWSDDTNHWATTSGGLPGAGNLPTAADNANFDSLSNATAYTVTLNTAVAKLCLDFNMAAPLTGAVTWAGTQSITISGSLNLSGGTAGITRTYTGAITFNSTATGRTLSQNGVTLASALTFNGSGGGWTLSDALTTTGNCTLTAGALSTGTKALGANNFISAGAATRSLDMSGSTITLQGTTTWNVSASLSLTVNTSSTISMANDNSTFTGAGLTYNDVTWSSATLTSPAISGANTIRNLTLTGFTAATGITFLLTNDLTVTGTFSATGGGPTSHPTVRGTVIGTVRTIAASAGATLTNMDFSDIAVTGAGAPWSGTRLGDKGGNSGITFTTPTNKYWRGNTNSWESTNWALTSGGVAAANNFPLPQDTAVFDANSFSANNQTISIAGGALSISAIDFSAVTKTGITLNLATSTNFYGSITLLSSMVIAGTSACTFSGRGTMTVTSAGVPWTQDLLLNCFTGTVTFGDALTQAGAADRTLTLTTGILDINKTVTPNLFASNNSNVRTITFSTGGKLAPNSTAAGTSFNVATGTNLTITRSGGTIEIGGNTTNVRTFAGGSKTWPTVTFTNTTASGELDFTGSNTFKSLAYTGGTAQTLAFTAGTTTTIEDDNGFPSGTAGNIITIGSITAAGHTLTKSGGGLVSCDYLSISRSTATPGSTWYAGTNSTDGGNNSGWIFAAPSGYTIVCDNGSFTLTGQDVTFTYTPRTTTVVDTHDGFDSHKRHEEHADAKERLRYMLQHAIDPAAFPWPIPLPVEAAELAEEFTERLESGRVEIDWARLERESVTRAKLYALAEEHARLVREFEEDEEDVVTLLLH